MLDLPTDADAGSNDDDFEAGFNAAPPSPTTTPESKQEQVAEPAQAAAEQPAPKLAQITEEQYQDLLKRATAIDEIKADSKKRFDDVFGKVGGMQQLIQSLQASTQTGQQVSVTKEDFAELVEEGYPDLAELQAAGLNRILAKLNTRGTGGAQPQAFDPKQVEEIVNNRLASEREQSTREQLFDMHEDWEQVRATPEYEVWVKENKIAERKDRAGATYEESWNPTFIGNLITEFKATKKAATTRQNRLEAAITPQGSGGHAPAKTDDDDFEAGFRSKSH